MPMEICDHLPLDHAVGETVLTIGTFDGVHRGHQHLLRQVAARARQTGRTSAAISFHPHPRAVLRPESSPTYLSLPAERAALVEALGIDLFVVLPFTHELAERSARDFVQWLCADLHMRELWVGPDFAMARGREGDVPRLRELAGECGYHLQVVPPLQDAGGTISSSRIRALLLEGQVAAAADLLGRLYAVSGEVIHGFARGRNLGFRTANVAPPAERLLPPDGVYAVWAEVDGRRLPGVANVGIRPSFDAGRRLIETHLLDYDGDLYGHDMTVAFAHYLRPELRFEQPAALVAQVQADMAAARRLLREADATE
jgi:riboflavin kinase/FMN adenylyltransferase